MSAMSQGSGLGLTIVDEAATAMGGHFALTEREERWHLRHAVAALAGLILWAMPVQAFQIEASRSFGAAAPARVIEVLSTTDIDVLAPVIEEFLQRNPSLGVHYTLASSQRGLRGGQRGWGL